MASDGWNFLEPKDQCPTTAANIFLKFQSLIRRRGFISFSFFFSPLPGALLPTDANNIIFRTAERSRNPSIILRRATS